MTKRILSVMAAFLLSVPLFAGTGTSTSQPTVAQIVADEVARLTVLLTLTSDQQTKATSIFTTEETALEGIQTNLETAQTALKTAILANKTADIGSESTAIGSLTAQQVLAQATAEAAFYQILTTAQQTKYGQLIQTGILGQGGSPGFGGGGGGRPGGH